MKEIVSNIEWCNIQGVEDEWKHPNRILTLHADREENT